MGYAESAKGGLKHFVGPRDLMNKIKGEARQKKTFIVVQAPVQVAVGGGGGGEAGKRQRREAGAKWAAQDRRESQSEAGVMHARGVAHLGT